MSKPNMIIYHFIEDAGTTDKMAPTIYAFIEEKVVKLHYGGAIETFKFPSHVKNETLRAAHTTGIAQKIANVFSARNQMRLHTVTN